MFNFSRWYVSTLPGSILLVFFLSGKKRGVYSLQVACTSDEECEKNVGFGSVCNRRASSTNINKGEEGSNDIEGNGDGNGSLFCSNPFEQGCLEALYQSSDDDDDDWKIPPKKRMCNSDDPMPQAVENGLCRVDNDFNHMEIRIFSQNWDSATFEAWVLQVVLSEILDVPTTIEPGTKGPKLNFYDPDSSFDYGKPFDWEALGRTSRFENGDCTLARRDDSTSYESCAHFFGQTWDGGEKQIEELEHDGHIDKPTNLGMVGMNGWYIPKFTADRDPSLMSYFGMKGEENRHKLADMFRRPTTWGEYCKIVSPDNCQTGFDGVALRAPINEEEEKRYFVSNLYLGHFRKTEKNDCEKYPKNCTGHYVAYPCFWESFVVQQLHHLDIALEVDYNASKADDYFSSMLEMYLAANATKSNIIMQWWSPEVHHQRYMETPSELQRVTLPPPTEKCVRNRADLVGDERCAANYKDLIGNPEGSCDQAAINIRKLIVTALHPDAETAEALKSPSYEVLNRFSLSELHFGELFRYQQEKRTVREAVCTWIHDNIDMVKKFVPQKFPRVLQENEKKNDLLFLISAAISVFAAVIIALAAYLVYKLRYKTSIKNAQLEFLRMLLAGSFIVALGAIATAMPPSYYTCASIPWLINIGYTLELVPMLVKIAAINTLLQSAKKMKKIKIEKKYLYGIVCAIMLIVVIFLITWTVVDPFTKMTNYKLTEKKTDSGKHVVVVYHYCGSKSRMWWVGSCAWNVLLLFGAAVLAFQARNNIEDVNESKELSMHIYSNGIFVILRFIILFLPASEDGVGIDQMVLARWGSIVFGCDTIASVVIYFIPKFLAKEKIERKRNSSSIIHSSNNFHSSNTQYPSRGPVLQDSSDLQSSTLFFKKEATSYVSNISKESVTFEHD